MFYSVFNIKIFCIKLPKNNLTSIDLNTKQIEYAINIKNNLALTFNLFSQHFIVINDSYCLIDIFIKIKWYRPQAYKI